MGKSHKKRKRQKRQDACSNPKDPSSALPSNPLYHEQQKFLHSIPEKERNDFFSINLNPERRGELWMEQADLGETLINKHSWATPDERCLRILRHFSPIIEIGCGANVYWSRFMSNAGIDVVAYDVDPQAGGTINGGAKKQQQAHSASNFEVHRGGPEVLEQESGRALFLCYPDEDGQVQVGESKEPMSMGAACLEYFTGNHVIHMGELYGDTLAVDQAPWGRSSGPDFQLRLASEFHCILKAGLSNWLHVRDTISVWKRTETCPIVFAADSDDEEEDEEIEYRYIPESDRLPVDIAAPCLAHLLSGGGSDRSTDAESSVAAADGDAGSTPKKANGDEKIQNGISKATATVKSSQEYVCPW